MRHRVAVVVLVLLIKVYILELHRGIPTGTVCPPVSLKHTFLDFDIYCCYNDNGKIFLRGQAPPSPGGLLDGEACAGVGPAQGLVQS